MSNLFLIAEMGVGGFLIRTLLIAALAYFSTQFLKGVYVKSFTSALLLAIVLALLNATLGWVLSVLAMPIDFLTLSLFSGLIALIINAMMIKIADGILEGFKVNNFWWAIALAAILSIGSSILNLRFGVSM